MVTANSRHLGTAWSLNSTVHTDTACSDATLCAVKYRKHTRPVFNDSEARGWYGDWWREVLFSNDVYGLELDGQ